MQGMRSTCGVECWQLKVESWVLKVEQFSSFDENNKKTSNDLASCRRELNSLCPEWHAKHA